MNTEDTSPCAQTGYSIWSIGLYNSRSLTVLVHDIERCSSVNLEVLNVKSDVKKIRLLHILNQEKDTEGQNLKLKKVILSYTVCLYGYWIVRSNSLETRFVYQNRTLI